LDLPEYRPKLNMDWGGRNGPNSTQIQKKNMFTVFYDIKGVALINWLPRANHSIELISVKKLSSRLQLCFKHEGGQMGYHSYYSIQTMPNPTISNPIWNK
jgi:hypothetical protein